MTELSTLGRAALYDYMVAALTNGGNGALNKAALSKDTRISDDDLRQMIAIVCEVGEVKASDKNSLGREQLVQELSNLIEHVSSFPGIAADKSQPEMRRRHDDD